MRIGGLQKLTLLDFPEVVSCIVFTKGCNFRCPFCHNASLVEKSDEEISPSEVLSFLKKRQGLLDGVVITGGEPLLNPDIPAFLSEIRDMGYKIKLDTNGSKPKLLKEIVSEGLLDYVAMDIKNSPEEYIQATGVDKFLKETEESKDFLLEGNIPYEFRTTVVRGIHTKESVLSLAKWIEGAEKYYLQQYKDSGEILNPEGLSSFSNEEMEEFLKIVSPYTKSSFIRNF